MILHASTESDVLPGTTEALFPVVYKELKRLARVHLRRRDGRETICTTELVHEAFLRLNTRGDVTWDSRAHFFGSASRAMREILVDFARKRQSAKRSGNRISLATAESETALELELDQILAVDEALFELDGLNPRLRQIVELRFFGGIHHEEIAKMLSVSVRTIERDWLKARLFLLRELKSTA